MVADEAGKVGSDGRAGKVESPQNLRKIAKFLFLLGKAEADRILAHLPKEAAEVIRDLIQEITSVEPVEAEALMQEFGQAAQRQGIPVGGGRVAREMLEKSLGEERARRILRKVFPEMQPAPFGFLKDYTPEQVRMLLEGESVLVLSLVLPHVDRKVAAQILGTLPVTDRVNLVQRIAKVDRVNSEVVQRVEAALLDKARSLSSQETVTVDGKAQLSGILRSLAPEDAESLLSSLEDTDPELAQTLRNRLFTQDRLLRLRDVDLEVFLRKVEDEDLALVTQALPEETAQKILRNVSERRRQWIRDEIELRGPPARIELDAALREFLGRVRMALADGEIRYEEDDEDVVE